MSHPAFKITLRISLILSILLSGFFVSSVASANTFEFDFLKPANSKGKSLGASADEDEELFPMRRMAREYRSLGAEAQGGGNYQAAMSFYQRAVYADPQYATAYNDLGITAEALGNILAAEEAYKVAIMVDPGYLGAYYNLASLYQGQRMFEEAATYWEKRIDLGDPNDPWTERASERLNDVYYALGKDIDVVQENKAVDLALDISDQKELMRSDNLEAAKVYMGRAKGHYQRDELAEAFRDGISAMQLDPRNEEISEFVEKIQLRLLTK